MICCALRDMSRTLSSGSYVRIFELTKSLEATLIHGNKFRRMLRYVNSLSFLSKEKSVLIFDYYPSLIDFFLLERIMRARANKTNVLFDVADIPYLQAIHFGVSKTISEKLRRDFFHLIGLADTLLFISPTLRSLLEPSALQGKKTLIISNASNPDFFKSTPLPRGKKKIVLCVSGYAPQRGIEVLISAFHRIRKRNRNIILKLVGYNMPFKLKTEGVIVERNKYYPHMPKVFSDSYVCVVPHLKNPYMESALPIKLYDAMASSRPSVVTDCLEMKKLVETEKCGIATQCNAKSLSEAIDFLLSNKTTAEEMGLRAREAIEKRHSWKHRAKTIQQHLRLH